MGLIKDNKEYKYVMRMSTNKDAKGCIFMLYKYKMGGFNYRSKESYLIQCFMCRLYSDYERSYDKAVRLVGEKYLLVLDKHIHNKNKQDIAVFDFGKYRGEKVDDVYLKDKEYIYWVASSNKGHSTRLNVKESCINYAIQDKKSYIVLNEYAGRISIDFEEDILCTHEFLKKKYRFLSLFMDKNRDVQKVYHEFNDSSIYKNAHALLFFCEWYEKENRYIKYYKLL